MKYKKTIWIILCSIVLIISIDQYLVHEVEIKVFFRFDENQILGHSREEVILKYGEFDRALIRKFEREEKVAEYAGLYKVGEHVDLWGPNFNIYYWVLFSEDDIAIAIDTDIPPDEQ